MRKRVVFITNAEKYGGPALVAVRVCSLLSDTNQCEIITQGFVATIPNSHLSSDYRAAKLSKYSLIFLYNFLVNEYSNFKNTLYVGFGTKQSLLLCALKFMFGNSFKLVIRTGLISNSSIPKKGNFFKDSIQLPLCQKLYPLSDGIITETSSMRNWWIEQGYSPAMVRHINNPLKHLKNTRKETKLVGKIAGNSSPILLCIGRLSYQKDHDFMIRSFKSYVRKYNDSSAILIILGAGPERENLENLIKNSGLVSRVKLIGHVKNVQPFLEISDLYCLTSRWEGGVNSLIEALCYGSKILALDCPVGPSDILNNMPGCELVFERDVATFADKINILLRKDVNNQKFPRNLDAYSDSYIKTEYLNFFKVVS